MTAREQFIFQMGRLTSASRGDVERIMRFGATHVRLETELTKGYKHHAPTCQNPRPSYLCCEGVEDVAHREASTKKRDRIDQKLEDLCSELYLRVEYGALTVRIVNPDGREIAIP